MSDLTRRDWIVQSLSITGAAFVAQLPPQFSTPAPPPCDPSTRPTPARKALAAQTGHPGAQLTLEGFVIGLRCGVIGGAIVTAWTGNSTATVTTDADGRYRVQLALPKVAAPRVNVRVDVPKSAKTAKTTFATSLFLPDEIARAGNAKAPGFDPLLRMKLITQTPAAITASFDVILDL